jgi:hypothetical protein
LIKRKIDEHPRRWYEVLSEALWAHRISCHGATKTLPYHLVYGQEAKVARAYNKKVKLKEFQVRDLVWEAVLLLGTKDATYGKWSPNWHEPYRIDQVLPGNAYMLEELDSVKFPVAVNG